MKPPVIVIVGPTAVGKTKFSLDLAEKYNAEIISADSRQVYRYMDIGTAKPTRAELEQIRHHFINYREPDQKYTAGDFAADARKKIMELLSKNKNVIVVGGSGLYIRALLYGIIEQVDVDENIRSELMARLKTEGLAVLYSELKSVDPVLAERLSPNDKQRILRGLEVYFSSGSKLSDLQNKNEIGADFPFVQIGLTMNRAQLYKKINQRVDKMIEAGLVDEVKDVIRQGYANCNALNTVGYKEIISFLNKEIDLETAIRLIKQNSRRYAKRQMTWFKKDSNIQWVTVENFFSLKTVAHNVSEILKKDAI